MKIAVVGTGPSGWSAVKKLISLGHEVWVYDAGLIQADSVKAISGPVASNLNRKLYFDSDLPYWSFPHGPSSESYKVNPVHSFARGGLSLVWGATMLPYCKEDTHQWPIDISTFEKFYSELSREIPITGSLDGLSGKYGNFYSRQSFFPSTRIVRFLESCNKRTEQGIQLGLSRLAVETGSQDIAGCIYCNQCINGCPSNLIWNSYEEIRGARYLKLRVDKLIEDSHGVIIEGIDMNGKSDRSTHYDKVFLGSGSLESFRILANSKIVRNVQILKDSATFFVPIIVLPKISSNTKNTFGLSQLFIRLDKTKVNPASQYQIYEYSEDLIPRARKALPFGEHIPNWFLRFFLKRMMVAIGYLDSDDSPSIRIRFLENGSTVHEINPSGVSSVDCKALIKISVIRLAKYTRKHGLFPIRFLTQFAIPGEGAHFGSWLPIGDKSDFLGRPHGSKKIHVIDSSVLPSIAPGPITFTVMANAMRIAEAAIK